MNDLKSLRPLKLNRKRRWVRSADVNQRRFTPNAPSTPGEAGPSRTRSHVLSGVPHSSRGGRSQAGGGGGTACRDSEGPGREQTRRRHHQHLPMAAHITTPALDVTTLPRGPHEASRGLTFTDQRRIRGPHSRARGPGVETALTPTQVDMLCTLPHITPDPLVAEPLSGTLLILCRSAGQGVS